MPNPLDEYALFSDAVRARLVKGQASYGRASFTDTPVDTLFEEIIEELLDINGWSYIMWRRLKRIQGQLPNADPEPPRG